MFFMACNLKSVFLSAQAELKMGISAGIRKEAALYIWRGTGVLL
jgi:hypothetical protein